MQGRQNREKEQEGWDYTFTSMAWIGTAACLLLKQGQSHELEPVSMAIYKLNRYSHMNFDLFSQ